MTNLIQILKELSAKCPYCEMWLEDGESSDRRSLASHFYLEHKEQMRSARCEFCFCISENLTPEQALVLRKHVKDIHGVEA